MSAPGIRAVHLARELARGIPDAAVELAVPDETDIEVPDVAVRAYPRWTGPMRIVQGAETVVTPGLPPTAVPGLGGTRLVVDLFTFFLVEHLAWTVRMRRPPQRWAAAAVDARYYNYQVAAADLVLCSNERQRDLWIGTMLAAGAVTPDEVRADPHLARRIAVVPFGARPEPPIHDGRMRVKGVHPGVAHNDLLVVWNGGILNWYDPLSLLRAWERVVAAVPNARLWFMGVRYPYRGFSEGDMLDRAVALAEQLNLRERSVFFNFGWLDYEEAGQLMLEADLAVSTYFDSLETRLSYRTRLTDCVWAGLPFVCTAGDVLGDEAAARGMAATVPAGDVDALTATLVHLLQDAGARTRLRAALEAHRAEYSWRQAAAPLVDYCRRPPAGPPRRGGAPLDLARNAATYIAARGVQQLLQPERWFRRTVDEPGRTVTPSQP